MAEATEDELYSAMDWLLERQQPTLRRDWTGGHLCGGGALPAGQARVQPGRETREAADRVWAADQRRRTSGRRGLCGDTGDPSTFQGQVQKVGDRFGVAEVVWVADRGMLTSAQVEQLQEVVGAHWITALRGPLFSS